MVGTAALKKQDLIPVVMCWAKDAGNKSCLFLREAPEKYAGANTAIGTVCFQALLPVPGCIILFIPEKTRQSEWDPRPEPGAIPILSARGNGPRDEEIENRVPYGFSSLGLF